MHKNRSLFVITLVLLVSAGIACGAGPVRGITLEQALGRALEKHPGLRERSWRVRAAEAAETGALVRPAPELEFAVEEFGGPGQFREFDGAEYSLLISQPLELAGKRGKRGRVARLYAEAAGQGLLAARLEVASQVSRAFYGVLAAQQRVAVTGELLDLSKKALGSVEKRVSAGKDPELELTRAELDHSRIRLRYEKALSSLDTARAKLAASWGGAAADFGEAEGELDDVSEVPALEQLEGMLLSNPEIEMSAIEARRSEAAYELEKALSWPDLTIRGGVKRFAESGDETMILGVSLPLPLFDRNQGGRLEAEYAVSAAEEGAKAVAAGIRAELVEAYNELKSAHAEAEEMGGGILEGAASVFEGARRSYEEGKADYISLLEAQRTLYEVRMHHIEVLLSYHSARAEVARLTGVLPVGRPDMSREE